MTFETIAFLVAATAAGGYGVQVLLGLLFGHANQQRGLRAVPTIYTR